MMRRTSPRFAFVTVVLAAAACTASGSNDQTHGPIYDLDASSNADARGGVITLGDASVVDAPAGFDVALADAPAEGVDAIAPDGSASDAADASSCTGVTAIMGGSASSVFGASAAGHGALAAQAINGTLASAPGLAPFGSGFQALVREAGNVLASVSLAPPAWSSPAALTGGPLSIDVASVVAVGGQLHSVYLGTNNRYYHATFSGTAWDAGGDPVGHLGDGGTQAFGHVRAAVAGLAAELAIAYQGNDGHLYAQSWTSAAGWGNAVQIGTVSVATNVAPAVVALEGGTRDLLVAYEDAADTKIYSFARDAASKAWNVGPTVVDATAFTHEAPSLAAMSSGGGRALVAWRGTDGLGYASAYDPATPAWSTPAPLVAGTNPALAAAPALTHGNCGDDVSAAFVSGGAVSVARYAGGAWSVPAAVSGVTGATFVTIATAP